MPPGIAGYQKGVWADSKYDVDRRQGRARGRRVPGRQGPPEIKLSFNTDGGHEKIMQLVQADLAKIGIKTTLRLGGLPDLPEATRAPASYQIGRLGWIADYPIMDNFIYPIFNSQSADNYSKYNNPPVDTGINDARSMTDSAARIAAYQEIDKTIQATNPVVPLMFYKHHHVGSSACTSSCTCARASRTSTRRG